MDWPRVFSRRRLLKERQGRTGQALKTVAESLAVANPYRYVRMYTGYGQGGVDLLEEVPQLAGQGGERCSVQKKEI